MLLYEMFATGIVVVRSARAPSGGALHWRGLAGRLACTEPILCTVVPEQEGKRMARRRL
jgi:hypothetical protein